jgi:hypothetical protein
MSINTDSPLALRIAGYLAERFPPLVYTLLVVLFFGSAQAVAVALGGSGIGPVSWLGAVVVWLIFFHIRVFDEHKDFGQDRHTHPERLLSRGVVTLPLLAKMGAIAIVLEVALSASLGLHALLWWVLSFAFTVAMLKEFGIGAWLGPKILTYAISHNPVVALTCVYAWACSGADWHPAFLCYVACISFAMLAFELARKIHLPEEEIEGVDSYTSVHGRGRAIWMLRGTMLLAMDGGLATLYFLEGDLVWTFPGFLLLSAFAMGMLATGMTAPSKRVEGGVSAFLLLSFAALWGAAW